MNALRAFGRFWYDLVVGDDWKIPVAVLIALVTTGILMMLGWFADGLLTAIGAVLVVAAFVLSLGIDVRRS